MVEESAVPDTFENLQQIITDVLAESHDRCIAASANIALGHVYVNETKKRRLRAAGRFCLWWRNAALVELRLAHL
jgi:hypothetical protein